MGARYNKGEIEKVDSYVQSVPHDTRMCPSVDAVKPRTAPR